jgi:hypothetical protein
MAGDREKQRYEELKRKIEINTKKTRRMGCRAGAEKVSIGKGQCRQNFTLEKDRRDLEKTKGGLKEQVKQLTKERDQEMQIREAIQKTITDTTSKYKVDPMPWDY